MRDIALVTPFPRNRSTSVEFSALGTYSRMYVACLGKDIRQRLVVFSQKPGYSYKYLDAEVRHVWTRCSPFYFFELISAVDKQFKYVHFQYETYCFGGLYLTFLFVPTLLVMKLLGKKVVVSLHGVVSLNTIDAGFLKDSGVHFPVILTKVAIRILYVLIGYLSDKIVVLNPAFKTVLTKEFMISAKKIREIPHMSYRIVPRQMRSQFLKSGVGKHKYFLFFGFLARYKGLETLINSMRLFDLKKHGYIMIIAGCMPYRLRNDEIHKKWLMELKRAALQISENIVWDTRYVPDTEMRDYFKRAELVILPYSESLGASGPFTVAMSTGTPVAASEALAGVVPSSMIFGSSSEDLARFLNKFTSSNLRHKLLKDLKRHKSQRSPKRVGQLSKALYE